MMKTIIEWLGDPGVRGLMTAIVILLGFVGLLLRALRYIRAKKSEKTDVAKAGQKRIRLLREYLGKLKQDLSTVTVLERSFDLKKLYTPVYGTVRPEPVWLAEVKRVVDATATQDVSPKPSSEVGDRVAWELLRTGDPSVPMLGTESPPPKPWIVLGDAGAGKATWLKHEALMIAEDAEKRASGRPESVRIPIVVQADAFQSAQPLRNLQVAICGHLDLPDDNEAVLEFIRPAWEEGRCVLFIDAFEKADETARKNVLAVASAAAKKSCPVFITAHTSAWEPGLDAECLFYLAPFSGAARFHFVNTWFDQDETDVAKTLLKKLGKDLRAAELAHNPLMLTFICAMWEDRKDFPRNRAELMHACLTRLMRRRGKLRRDLDTYYHYKVPLLESLGARRLTLKGPFSSDCVHDAISAISSPTSWSPQSLAGLLKELVEQDGILNWRYEDGGMEKYYDFSIALLGEYLAACALARRPDWETCVSQNLQDPGWYSVLPLLAGEFSRIGHNENVQVLLRRLAEYADDLGTEDEGLDLSLAKVITNCLGECFPPLPPSVSAQVWATILRVPDRSQARLHDKQWDELAQPELIESSLRAARLCIPNSKTTLAGRAADIVKEEREAALRDMLEDPAPVVRWLGAWYAGGREVGSLYSRLQELFQDTNENPYVRSIAARAAVRLDQKRAIPHVLDVLNEGEGSEEIVASGAAIALGAARRPDTDVLHPLLDKAKASGTGTALFSSVLEALDWYIGSNRSRLADADADREELASLFMAVLRQEDPRSAGNHATAASALGKLGWTDAVELLKKLAFDDKTTENVRGSACFGLEQMIDSLSESDKNEFKTFLQAQLKNYHGPERVGTRRVAASALGKFGDATVVDDLLKIIAQGQDENDTVVRNALFAVLKVDAVGRVSKVVETLCCLPAARMSALLNIVLSHPSPVGVKLCLRLLEAGHEDPQADRRIRITLYILAKLPDAIRMLSDSERRLGACFDKETVRTLAEWCLDHLDKPDAPARCASLGVLESLARCGLPGFADDPPSLERAKQQTILLLDSEDVSEQASALVLFQALVRLSNNLFDKGTYEDVLNFCIQCLNHSEKVMRKNAAGTLGRVGLIKHISPLRKLLKNENELPTVQRVARYAIAGLLAKTAHTLENNGSADVEPLELGRLCLTLATECAPIVAINAMRVIASLAKINRLPVYFADVAAEVALNQVKSPSNTAVLASALVLVQRFAASAYLRKPENRSAAIACAWDYLEHHEESVRASAPGLLGQLGEPRHLERLKALRAKEASGKVLKSIAWALSTLEEQEAEEARKAQMERVAAEYSCPPGFLLGMVRKLLEKGGRQFGFIQCRDGDDYYFNPEALAGPRWDNISEGLVVVFKVKREPDGQKAGAAEEVQAASRLETRTGRDGSVV